MSLYDRLDRKNPQKVVKKEGMIRFRPALERDGLNLLAPKGRKMELELL